MTLEGLEHIGIAVSDLEEALALYEGAFGLKAESIVTLEERNVRVAFLPLGNTKIELLEPLGEGALSRFLKRRGEGLHHIALQLDNGDSGGRPAALNVHDHARCLGPDRISHMLEHEADVRAACGGHGYRS